MKKIKLGVPGLNGSKGFGFNGTSSVILVPNSAEPQCRNRGPRGHRPCGVLQGSRGRLRPDPEGPELEHPGGDWKIEIVNVGGLGIARCYLKGSAGSWQKTTGPNLADGKWHTITCEKHATTVAAVGRRQGLEEDEVARARWGTPRRCRSGRRPRAATGTRARWTRSGRHGS